MGHTNRMILTTKNFKFRKLTFEDKFLRGKIKKKTEEKRRLKTKTTNKIRVEQLIHRYVCGVGRTSEQKLEGCG